MSQFFTLVNRTSKPLKGTWDGRHYDLAPGKHSFPEIMALKFRDQNPVKGTQDPRTGDMLFLIGIEELDEDCSPIEQSNAIELIDRSKLNPDQQNIRVITGSGMYAPRIDPSSAQAPNLPGEGFSKP